MEPVYRGKVRDIYHVDDERMILVSSDRVSAFDVVFSEEIPGKGIYLNEISSMWFRYLEQGKSLLFGKPLSEELSFKTHFIHSRVEEYPSPYRELAQSRGWKHRSMLVWKTQRIDFECIVRGYLLGSAWKEYRMSRKVAGLLLPEGLSFGDKLPEPLFTPATKEEAGKHDENVDMAFMESKTGKELAERLKEISLAIFQEASLVFGEVGFILCDTKFEFGLKDGEIYLIDEVLTPDSSRFWKKGQKGFDSYDKQILRDYLETLGWNKEPPPPPLPPSLVEELEKRYKEVYSLLREYFRDRGISPSL